MLIRPLYAYKRKHSLLCLSGFFMLNRRRVRPNHAYQCGKKMKWIYLKMTFFLATVCPVGKFRVNPKTDDPFQIYQSYIFIVQGGLFQVRSSSQLLSIPYSWKGVVFGFGIILCIQLHSHAQDCQVCCAELASPQIILPNQWRGLLPRSSADAGSHTAIFSGLQRCYKGFQFYFCKIKFFFGFKGILADSFFPTVILTTGTLIEAPKTVIRIPAGIPVSYHVGFHRHEV